MFQTLGIYSGGKMWRLQGRGDRRAELYVEEEYWAQRRQGCSCSPSLVPRGAATVVLGWGGGLPSQLAAALVPTGLTAPARQWTESTAALEWLERGCSQQTETGIWAERRFRTKAWVSPLGKGREEKKREQYKKGEKSRTPFIFWPHPQMTWIN